MDCSGHSQAGSQGILPDFHDGGAAGTFWRGNAFPSGLEMKQRVVKALLDEPQALQGVGHARPARRS
jgi:hypothetical protein